VTFLFEVPRLRKKENRREEREYREIFFIRFTSTSFQLSFRKPKLKFQPSRHLQQIAVNFFHYMEVQSIEF
jgi:hypothetical protein